MRHQKEKKILSRKRDQRRALLRSLMVNFINNGDICTTERRAKELAKKINHLLHQAQVNSTSGWRQVERILGNKSAVNKLIKNLIPKLKKVSGSYVKIIKLSPRKGDGAKRAKLLLITDEK